MLWNIHIVLHYALLIKYVSNRARETYQFPKCVIYVPPDVETHLIAQVSATSGVPAATLFPESFQFPGYLQAARRDREIA